MARCAAQADATVHSGHEETEKRKPFVSLVQHPGDPQKYTTVSHTHIHSHDWAVSNLLPQEKESKNSSTVKHFPPLEIQSLSVSFGISPFTCLSSPAADGLPSVKDLYTETESCWEMKTLTLSPCWGAPAEPWRCPCRRGGRRYVWTSRGHQLLCRTHQTHLNTYEKNEKRRNYILFKERLF